MPYVGIYKFMQPAIIARDPDLIKDIIIKDQAHFQANDFIVEEKHDKLWSKNPFFCSGEKWKRMRSMLVPLYTASKVNVHKI